MPALTGNWLAARGGGGPGRPHGRPLLIASALFWVAAVGLFVAAHGRMLAVPRRR